MDNFYTVIITIAIIALIVTLTYIGIILKYGENQAVYPPTSMTCPDYWDINQDGSCMIPKDGEKNVGSLYEGGLLNNAVIGNTPGIDQDSSIINFTHADWKASGTEVCSKREWASKHGVVWDGVSNYNDC